MSKKNPNDLTPEEIAVLRSASTPEPVKQFMARQHDNVAAKASAYRKVAELARQEREMLMEVAAVELARESCATVAELKNRNQALTVASRELEAVVKNKDEQITRMIATPALAVSGNGTG